MSKQTICSWYLETTGDYIYLFPSTDEFVLQTEDQMYTISEADAHFMIFTDGMAV